MSGPRLPTILIVEDEFLVAMDIERILLDAGYHVVAIATDSEEALGSAPKADIAFVDLNLRDGPTGPVIARDLARSYGTKVIYVTANPAQIEPRAETAIGFLRKPFTDVAILAAAAIAADRPIPAAGVEAITLFDPPSGGS